MPIDVLLNYIFNSFRLIHQCTTIVSSSQEIFWHFRSRRTLLRSSFKTFLQQRRRISPGEKNALRYRERIHDTARCIERCVKKVSLLIQNLIFIVLKKSSKWMIENIFKKVSYLRFKDFHMWNFAKLLPCVRVYFKYDKSSH